ncbi:hypothetical protein [Candidatus Bathycorpusculum sp.]|uniref:hypothetical protein n=1 Tax=Candidatus Bathycorpusculum sp. TaxID=2994959 RepID=UPI002830418A|nr:hypothetical protein [Candidatus Termitimicrobium sp.]MCL2432084.1 hypothetical protein [Candidatus Termitimicrobium sp.]
MWSGFIYGLLGWAECRLRVHLRTERAQKTATTTAAKSCLYSPASEIDKFEVVDPNGPGTWHKRIMQIAWSAAAIRLGMAQ